MLPFTPEQFLSVFVNYNTAIWPVQVGAYLLGCSAIVLLLWKASAPAPKNKGGTRTWPWPKWLNVPACRSIR